MDLKFDSTCATITVPCNAFPHLGHPSFLADCCLCYICLSIRNQKILLCLICFWSFSDLFVGITCKPKVDSWQYQVGGLDARPLSAAWLGRSSGLSLKFWQAPNTFLRRKCATFWRFWAEIAWKWKMNRYRQWFIIISETHNRVD